MPALARSRAATQGRPVNTEGRATLRLVAASILETLAVGFDPQFLSDRQIIKIELFN
jgi:hypothetical protein